MNEVRRQSQNIARTMLDALERGERQVLADEISDRSTGAYPRITRPISKPSPRFAGWRPVGWLS